MENTFNIWIVVILAVLFYSLGRYFALKETRKKVIIKFHEFDLVISKLRKYIKDNNIKGFEILYPLENFNEKIFKDFNCNKELSFFEKITKSGVR